MAQAPSDRRAPYLPRYLLVRNLAYRIQASAFGGLDCESARFLEKIARDREERRVKGVKASRKAYPAVPPVPERRSLKPGTLLVREHAGRMQQVMVLEDGFAWSGTTYRSLSEVARAITGTNWNGPRFFGLRDTPKHLPAPLQEAQDYNKVALSRRLASPVEDPMGLSC